MSLVGAYKGGHLKSGLIEQAGARHPNWINNIGLAKATVSATDDSIRILGSEGSSLSPLNYGWITLPSATEGRLVTLSVTDNVTFTLTNATFGLLTDATDVELTVYAINDAGTLKWGVSIVPDLTRILTADDETTASSVNLGREVFVNSALSGDAYCRPIGFVRADFTFSGTTWSIQNSTLDLRVGVSALYKLHPNYAYNTAGVFFQRTDPATPTNINDDAYGPDMWNILASANAVAISKSTNSIPGTRASFLLTKVTGAGQYGMCQFLPVNISNSLSGKRMTFSLYCRTISSEVSQIKIAILGWTSTADTVTSDVVSSWAASPTYAANWNELGAATLDLTNVFQQVAVSATISSTHNNIGLFVFATNSESVNDRICITGIQFHGGQQDQPYQSIAHSMELRKCQEFYEKSYNTDVVPGTSTQNGAISTRASGASLDTDTRYVLKNATPSIVLYSTTGASGNVRDLTGGSDSAATANDVGQNAFRVNASSTDQRLYAWHFTSDCSL